MIESRFSTLNPLGPLALLLSLCVFAWSYHRLRHRGVRERLLYAGGFAVMALPSLLFCVYYLHILQDRAWYFTLRSWPGSEFLLVFAGAAGGAIATFLPRIMVGFPLFAVVGLGSVPYLKPLLAPLPESDLQDRWEGDACLQTTAATCGPACIATILRSFGVHTTEREVAHACFSYSGGTEAWYLARYVRSRGLHAHFVFGEGFGASPGAPAVVGVRLGGAGHFIAMLGVHDGEVEYADPLRGRELLPLAKFEKRYQFTGFHLVITPR